MVQSAEKSTWALDPVQWSSSDSYKASSALDVTKGDRYCNGGMRSEVCPANLVFTFFSLLIFPLSRMLVNAVNHVIYSVQTCDTSWDGQGRVFVLKAHLNQQHG